ncbi:MAG: hypothetical protein ACOYD6_01970 [Limnochordia bacterium]|jgi:hypothetical protein
MTKIQTSLDLYQRDLADLLQGLENLYAPFYQVLPALEQDVFLTKEETRLLMERFFRAQPGAQLPIKAILRDIHHRIQASFNLLITQQELAALFTETLRGDEGEEFSAVLRLTGRISLLLDDIRDMSLNSIIFAARLTQGEAFSVISQQLRETSAQMQGHYHRFAADFAALRDWYRDFTSALSTGLDDYRATGQRLEEQIGRHFVDLMDSLEQIALIMEDLIGHGEEALGPVASIMGLIQVHDIIRQQTENLARILRDIQGVGQELSPEALHVFQVQALRLAVPLAENIVAGIEASLEELAATSGRLTKNLEEVQADMELISDVFVGDQGAIGIGFGLIAQAVSFIEGLIAQIGEKNGQLEEGKETLNRMLASAAGYFASISRGGRSISRLALMAKMELGRLGTDDAAAFSKDIDAMVVAVRDGVEENARAFRQMEGQVEGVITTAAKVLKENQRDLQLVASGIEEAQEELAIARNLAEESICALVKGFAELGPSVRKVEDNLARGWQLTEQARTVATGLRELLEELLALGPVAVDMEVEDPRLLQLMDNFTSYVERQIAQDVFAPGAFEVGSAGGELELF